MSETRELPSLPEPKTIIQIAPPHRWGGCLAIIQRVKPWGVQAFVSIPHSDRSPTRIYGRFNWDQFEPLFVAAPYEPGDGE